MAAGPPAELANGKRAAGPTADEEDGGAEGPAKRVRGYG